MGLTVKTKWELSSETDMSILQKNPGIWMDVGSITVLVYRYVTSIFFSEWFYSLKKQWISEVFTNAFILFFILFD
jgi:hypothetical protein